MFRKIFSNRSYRIILALFIVATEFGSVPCRAQQDTSAPVRLTNRDVWELNGEREPFTAIYINGRQLVPRGPDRKWRLLLPLEEGENRFSLVARDISGNNSAPTVITVIRDSIPPLPPEFEPFPLETTEAAVTFSGTIEPGCSLYLLGESYPANATGVFEFTETLGFGNNVFEFSVRDRAGNQSPSTTLTVTRKRAQTTAGYTELKPPGPKFIFPWWGWAIAAALVGGAAGTYYAIEDEKNKGQDDEERRDVTTIILILPRFVLPGK